MRHRRYCPYATATAASLTKTIRMLDYSTGDGEDDMSDELNMSEVMQLYDADVITDETSVYCDGMDGWCPFEAAKYMCRWPGEEEDEEGTPPESIYYETAAGENEEVTIAVAQQLIGDGVITAETNVWADNLADWTPLKDVAAGLGLELPAAAEPEPEPEPEPERPAACRPRQKTAVGRPRSMSRVVTTAMGKTM